MRALTRQEQNYIFELMVAARAAWAKLKIEYDRQCDQDRPIDEFECWSEGEALYEALAPFVCAEGSDIEKRNLMPMRCSRQPTHWVESVFGLIPLCAMHRKAYSGPDVDGPW